MDEKAIATEYTDSLDIENDAQKKEDWLKRQRAVSSRQLQLDEVRLLVPSVEEADDADEVADRRAGLWDDGLASETHSSA